MFGEKDFGHKEGLKIMEELNKTPDVVYMDLKILKDFYFPLMLMNVKDEKSYQYIIENINKYNKRLIDDPRVFFSELDLDFDFDEALAKVKNHDHLFTVSPNTNYIFILREFARSLVMQRGMTRNSVPTKVYINTAPLKLSKRVMLSLAELLTITTNLEVIVGHYDITNLPSKIIDEVDVMYIYYFKDFIENEKYKEAFQNEAFTNTYIFAPKHYYDKDLPKKYKKENGLDIDFDSTEYLLQYLTMFQYMPNPILNLRENEDE